AGFLSTTMLAGAVGGVFLTVQVARGADIEPVRPVFKALPGLLEPAVDGLNAKWDVLGGSLSHRSLYGTRGAFSVPLASQWGLQIDAQVGSLQQRAYGSIAGHLFSRNPSQGLLGLYVSHTHWDQFGGVHATQVAGEGAVYLGRFTVEGIAGVEFGNSVGVTTTGINIVAPVGPVPGLINVNTFTEGFDVRTRFFDHINVKYYF